MYNVNILYLKEKIMVSPYLLLAVPSVVRALLSDSDKKCIQTTETEGFFLILDLFS